jgi:putative phage-type endonuclease
MQKIIHNLEQGSQAWLDFRANHFGASEAAAMLGISKYQTRTALLLSKKTGITEEINEQKQALFDKGHATEALARTILEGKLEDDLYPAVYSKGKLSASVDGIDMAETFAFEHKLFNKALFDSINAGVLPDAYQPQCQQVLYVTGARHLYFVCSDGTEENFAMMLVEPDADWIARIIQGWDQFEKDLESFAAVEYAEKPKAEPVKALPALSIQIKGEVSLSNLPRFKEAAEEYLAEIKTDLETDDDFAYAEANVKYLDEAEKSLEQAKKAALSQTADIDELMRTIDHIKESMRSKRLSLDKLVKSKKEQIKADIVLKGNNALAAHVSALNSEIKPVVLTIRGSFAEVIKNKRTVASLQDAVDTELSLCKIEIDALAADVRKNLAHLNETAKHHKALFADISTLALKAPDDFAAVVQIRLSEEALRLASIEADAQARAELQAKAELNAQASPTQLAPQVLPATHQIEPTTKAYSTGKEMTYTIEVDDLLVLVKAISEGKAPVQCIQVDFDFLESFAKTIKSSGQLFPGVRSIASHSIAARAA